MSATPEWASTTGDAWARRWQNAEQALAGLAVQLDAAIVAAAPEGCFRALDIGYGAGSTSIALAAVRPEATIVACDLSPSLVGIARQRTEDIAGIEVVLGDAAEVATRHGPFDLFLSRHGVMFFDDPVRAFRAFAEASIPGAAILFSCFQDWSANPWASELASAAAGAALPPPGREPSGFAFAEPRYVEGILAASGWSEAQARPTKFRYVAGTGGHAVDEALSLLSELGPASRVLAGLAEDERGPAVSRMRKVVERRFDGRTVSFDAAAWIWSARR